MDDGQEREENNMWGIGNESGNKNAESEGISSMKDLSARHNDSKHLVSKVWTMEAEIECLARDLDKLGFV
ncbi:hypothetical protein R1flu_007182 [Riccia fluitans]|uniref:Uncharacterized protein n=1 Tax=Riccia fluitans TaxID=41844 RepID=A0ABD1YY45_9MARC